MTVGSSGKLTDLFSDLFVLGSSVREARDLGGIEPFRARLHQVFQRAEDQGRSIGIHPDTLVQTRYALTAFMDEMVFNSRWAHKDQWAARPLQYDFFGEFVAGEGFFKRLEAIRSAMPVNIDLLEVYALCLILGFEGQYQLHDREKLRGLVEDVTREIQAKRGEAAALSPHGARPEELIDIVKRDLPVWVVLVISAGIVFFFYLALSLLITHDANSVADELTRLLLEVKN